MVCVVRDGALHPAGPVALEWWRDMAMPNGRRVVVKITDNWGRSRRTHDHQFAWLADAHANLPEWYVGKPWAASPDTLRKKALIETGFCDVAEFNCATPDDAMTAARLFYKQATEAHGYAKFDVEGVSVSVFTPHSQSNKAMDAATFQRSKTAVLNWVAARIGVEPETLAREGGMSA